MNNILPAKQQPTDYVKNKRFYGLAIGIVLLLVVCVASLMIGAKTISFSSIIDIIFYQQTHTIDYVIIYESRMARTLLGLLCGVAFAMAGALMQAVTRNPLADPGILGVNSGASFSVILVIGLFGLNSIYTHIWLALIGAIIITSIVYIIGNMGRSGGNPVRMVLAGIAISAVLGGLGTAITLLNPYNFASTRIWTIGALAGRNMEIIYAVFPFIMLGIILAAIAARALNALALGDELARSLGINILRLRIIAIIAVTLLAGAGTAAVGPIGFIGLMVPHIVRWFTGPDQRFIIALSMVYGAVLLVFADIIGRLLLSPAELEAGIVTAFIGAPMLIMLVRFKKVSGL